MKAIKPYEREAGDQRQLLIDTVCEKTQNDEKRVQPSAFTFSLEIRSGGPPFCVLSWFEWAS